VKTLRLAAVLLPLLLVQLLSAAVPANASPAPATQLLRDELGRDVAVPDDPRRLVCLSPSVTDTVYSLGAGSLVVGVTDYTQYPPEAKGKPSVGGIINPSLEKIVALRPDLILAISDLNSLDLIRSIERLGIPVFVIRPHGMAGVYLSIASIGKAIHREQQAAALVFHLREREFAVHQRAADKRAPGVFYLIWPDPILTAGRGAFITELIEIAGGRSITADLPSEWPRIGFETLVVRQPEFLVLLKGSQVTRESLEKLAGWKRLDAVKNGKILYLDDRINLPSPAVFDALEDLARQLHP
jgi:ABC-type Fe3+-hydroxamate transport system substrate-binding protein